MEGCGHWFESLYRVMCMALSISPVRTHSAVEGASAGHGSDSRRW